VTPAAIIAAFGQSAPGVRCEDEGGMVTVDVPRPAWVDALIFARDELGCSFFDWLTAVDEGERGFAVVAHLYSIEGRHHLLMRTMVPRAAPVLRSAVGVFRGADWAEREVHEMFGLGFEGHPHLAPLLLPEGFEGHPLRKEFALAARAAQDWPGALEPGEREPSERSRRRLRPPGVPEGWQPR
jgi:NADH-quinone oxidoreductase subunit C